MNAILKIHVHDDPNYLPRLHGWWVNFVNYASNYSNVHAELEKINAEPLYYDSSHYPTAIKFNTEADKLLFLMRWS